MMRIWTSFAKVLAVVLLHAGCGSSSDPSKDPAWRTDDSTYVFEEPDDVFILSKDLEEISGLTMLEEGVLGAIQDEDGDLFRIDVGSGEILDRQTFGKKGDYEGIEVGGERMYILRSDGRLNIIQDWSGQKLQTATEEADLPKGCDAEGIAYQKVQERLLIVCKEKAGKKFDGKKAVYAYDPASKTTTTEPVYVLDIEGFQASIEDHPINEAVTSILSERMDISGFKPSGLAVHPHSGELYIVSSVTKAIIRLNESGEVTALWMLPAELHDQPEGIEFASNGDLFISNEAGDRKRATLLRYRSRGRSNPSQPSNE